MTTSGPFHRDCPFCAIILGKRHADVMFKLGAFSVFRPIGRSSGKVLIVPNQHYESLEAMPEQLRSQWMNIASEVSGLLGARAFRLQISCGAEAQNVRHLYAQFTYTEAVCPAAS